MRIRSGDTVLVIAGKDKGKTGRVDRQYTKENRVVVEGVNMITRHVRARPGIRQSGRIQQEAPATRRWPRRSRMSRRCRTRSR